MWEGSKLPATTPHRGRLQVQGTARPHFLGSLGIIPAPLPSVLKTQTPSVKATSMTTLRGTASALSGAPEREKEMFGALQPVPPEPEEEAEPGTSEQSPGQPWGRAMSDGEGRGGKQGPGGVKALLWDSGHLLPSLRSASAPR